MIIAKRNEEYRNRILQFIKSNGQATATELKLNVNRQTLETVLSDLVRDGELKRKRGFDALGRVRIVYTFSGKLK